jgi:CRISPR system Cascade subunit CasC
MFIELHILQNFAPSNLNRDDTGSPKDCEFGGVRRARISSQCLKRAIRRESNFQKVLEASGGGVRTRRLIIEIAERLDGKPAKPQTVKLVSEVFSEGGIERPKASKGDDASEKDNTKLLLYMDKVAIDKMAALFGEQREALASQDKDAKSAAVKKLGDILAAAVKAPDIALFGRMIEIDAKKEFGKRQLGVDAACQVAHAISTNKVSNEFDFYTAVDDLLPEGDTGAGMMGTVEFNSACYYRYANVDYRQLYETNLGGDRELALDTVEAFVRAAVRAVPTGKQNSMAARQPPSFVLAVARRSEPWSLTNAFVRPVQPTREKDLVEASVERLGAHWRQLASVYGSGDVVDACFVSLEGKEVEGLPQGSRAANLEELVSRVRRAVESAGEESRAPEDASGGKGGA